MSLEQLIISTFAKSPKYMYKELVAGQLATIDFNNGKNKGDEVNVLMPIDISVTDYAGGDIALNSYETLKNTTVKVKLDKGVKLNFKIDAVKKAQIENAPDLKQKISLIAEATQAGLKSYKTIVDKAFCDLYPNAGYVINDNGSAITATKTNVRDMFILMKQKFERGDGMSNHTSWEDGSMIAVIPPELSSFITYEGSELIKYTDKKSILNGEIGEFFGWRVCVTNSVQAKTVGNDSVFNPIFGIKGKSLVGGVAKEINLIHFVPEANFDDCYKGYSWHGEGAPRPDLLGTIAVKANYTIGN